MINITTIAEYEYLVNKGYCPLKDWKWFYIDFKLRLEIQYSIFGHGDFTRQNQRFYEWMWKNSIHSCEELGTPLKNYSASFISHIISKGSDRRLAIDPRNVNILSFNQHNKWEYGEKTKMKIYPKNKLIINILKTDYNL